MTKKSKKPAVRPKTRAAETGIRGLWRRNRVLFRSWLVFLVALGLFHVGLESLDDRVWDALNAGTARLTATSLWLLGAEGSASGPYVTSRLFAIEVIRECTGIHPIAIFIAAVLAYPCAWRPRLLGIAGGVLALLIVNQVRLVSLVYIGHWFPGAFETAHLLVWQSLIIFLTVLLWILWAVTFVRRDEVRPT